MGPADEAVGKGARAVSELAFWAGVLGGEPGTAGAGLLAAFGNSLFIAYAKVRKVVLRSFRPAGSRTATPTRPCAWSARSPPV